MENPDRRCPLKRNTTDFGGRLPDEVYTQRHPQSTSVLLSRESQNWGESPSGISILSDNSRRLGARSFGPATFESPRERVSKPGGTPPSKWPKCPSTTSPRVGDKAFCQTFESQVPNNLRFVIQGDPVAMVPRATLPGIASSQFVHAGRLFHIGEDGVAIRPNDIETRLARSRARLHANTAYFEAAQKRLQRASQPGDFQGKSRLPEQMAEAERKKSQ